ncbi:MAG: ParB/RepB/Spo0J family partition protein [Cyanobacteria bacterium J06642_2]
MAKRTAVQTPLNMLAGMGDVLGTGHQLAQSRERIEELETLNRELRSKLDSLNISSVEEAIDRQFDLAEEIIEIPVDRIRRFVGQPRQTFSPDSMRRMKRSLREDGQRDPVKVIRVADNDFLIWDGERRWRAANDLQWSTLKARVVEMPDDLHNEILKGFLSSEGLNSLDRAEALVEQISRMFEISSKMTASKIRSGYKKIERAKQGKLYASSGTHQEARYRVYEACSLDSVQIDTLEALIDFGINPASFVASDLRTLYFDDALRNAIRDRGLKVAVAGILNKLWTKTPEMVVDSKIEDIRTTAIRVCLEQDMSVVEAKQYVKQFYETSVNQSAVVSRFLAQLSSVNWGEVNGEEREVLKLQLKQTLDLLEDIERAECAA